MSITGGVQGTLGGMALLYMYTATDQGLWMGLNDEFVKHREEQI